MLGSAFTRIIANSRLNSYLLESYGGTWVRKTCCWNEAIKQAPGLGSNDALTCAGSAEFGTDTVILT